MYDILKAATAAFGVLAATSVAADGWAAKSGNAAIADSAVPVTLRLVDTSRPAADVETDVIRVQALTGDADAGETAWRACRACHSFEEGKNGAGPSLHGVMGATAGQVEGFRYSKAMKDSGIVWNEETLTAFITNPRDYVKRTSMSFRGERDPQKVADLIAYIAEASAAD